MRARCARNDMPTKSLFSRHIRAICRQRRHVVVPRGEQPRGAANLKELGHGG